MKTAILACVFWLILLAPAEAQYFVPNMAAPYGGQWYWTQPWTPQPYYYGGYYGGYYPRHYGRAYDRSRLDWLEYDVEMLRRHQRR